MKDVAVVKRYAKAFAEVAIEAGKEEVLLAELESLVSAWNESRDLRELMRNPMFASSRQEVLQPLFERLGISKETERFIEQLIEHKRISLLPEVTEYYRHLLDEAKHKLTIEVVSAVRLSAQQLASLKNRLYQLYKKDVTIIDRIDPRIIGGLVIKIGSRVIDGSIRAQLEILRESLVKEK